MTPQASVSRIFALLVPTVVVTIIISYIPHDLTLIRQVLSFVQLGFMAIIAVLTVRAVLEDF